MAAQETLLLSTVRRPEFKVMPESQPLDLPYDLNMGMDADGWKLEVTPKNPQVPLHVEFRHDLNGNLIEGVVIGKNRVEIKYGYEPETEAFIPQSLTITDANQRLYPDIPLLGLNPDAETKVAEGNVAIFVTHADSQFSPRDQKDAQWVIHFDHDGVGLTIPTQIDAKRAVSKLNVQQLPIDFQLFALSNDGFINEEIGFTPVGVPYAIGNLVDQSSNNEKPFIALVGQRLGHTKVILSLLYEAWKNNGWDVRQVRAYLPPTKSAMTQVEHFKTKYEMDPNLVKGFRYCDEPGYSDGSLPLEPTEPMSTKTMLAFLALNAHLTRDVLQNAQSGIVLYSDTKQDVWYYNALAAMLGIPIKVITKTYSHFENSNRFPSVGNGSELHKIMARAMAASADGRNLFHSLGIDRQVPDFLSFMFWKTQAAAKLHPSNQSLALYSTSGANAIVPTSMGKAEIVPIPLAFPSKYNKVTEPSDESYSTRAGRRKKLINKITDPTVNPPNIPQKLYDRLANDMEFPVILFQFGTSDNLYVDELITTVLETAQQDVMQNKLFLFTGFRQREEYLKKIKALTGLDEAELPPNIVIFGMRRDAENLHRIGDMTITTSSMGNMYDAVSTGTPMLCLAPDIITADNSAKLSRLLSEATTDTDRQKLVDRLAVMMETAPERALNLMMVASAYAEKGIDPNDAVFDISTLSKEQAVQELTHDILQTLSQKQMMAEAIKSIPILQAEQLFDILLIIRNGGTSHDIKEYISSIMPNFHPNIVGPVPAEPVSINLAQ